MANNLEKIKELMQKLQDISNNTVLKSGTDISYGGTWNGFGALDLEEYGAGEDGTGIDIDKLVSDVSEFWNESVINLVQKFEEELENYNKIYIKDNEENETIGTKHDAANSFKVNPYVIPDVNLLGEKYLEAREDEIEDVLQNSDNLDYTIYNKPEGYDGPGAEDGTYTFLNKYLTRLLMPQYARRVEIEDLNRNFWVIAQNLSLLNKLVLDFEDAPWYDALLKLMSEITGLWENVYRIWQAILYLAKEIDELSDSLDEIASQAAKTKVKLAYSWSWGTPSSTYSHTNTIGRLYKQVPSEMEDRSTLELTDTFVFQPGDSKFFGILPYIEKENIVYNEEGDIGYLFYLPFNKTITNERLNKYSDEQLDQMFIIVDGYSGPSKTGEIIGIERKFGNKPAREILKTVQSRNFVLVSPNPKGAIPILDELHTARNPIATALQFYRDFIYHIDNLENGEAFGSVVENTFTWMQGGYLKYLNFSTPRKWNDTDIIPLNIKESFNYISKTVFNNSVPGGIPNWFNNIVNKNQIEESHTINDLKTALLNSTYGWNLSKLITAFYNFYKNTVIYLDGKLDPETININNAPYFIDPESDEYVVDTSNRIEAFCAMIVAHIKTYNDRYASDNDGNYSFIPTIYLFAGQEQWFISEDNGSKDYLKIGSKYFKLESKNETLTIDKVSDDNSVLQWDLLSNMFFKDNFYIDNNPNDDFRQYVWDFNPEMVTEDEAMSYANSAVPKTSLYGGWWKEGRPNIVGSSYIYPREQAFGIWFDFIADPTKAKQKFLTTKINSYTTNETGMSWIIQREHSLSTSGPVWSAHHYYNTDVSIPFNDVANQSYWDFIRLGKPYPSIAKIIEGRVVGEDHLLTLNKEDNYIIYDTPIIETLPNTGYCIDGFYGFDSLEDYPLGENPTIPVAILQHQTIVDHKTGKTTTFVWRKHKGVVGEKVHYYGAPYLFNVVYEIASTDLINAYADTTIIKEGYTEIENHNKVNDPVINISYLSGETSPQQISIFISKDKTLGSYSKAINEPEPVIVVTSDAEVRVLKIGDFYPTDTNSNSLTEISSATGQYTTSVYGDGSYFLQNPSETKNVKFICYNDMKQKNRADLTTANLTNWGKEYLKTIYSKKIESTNKPFLVFTKIGVNFWIGESGSQWSNGRICDLFLVIPSISGDNKIQHLGVVGRLDGYWDDIADDKWKGGDYNVFKNNSNNSRSRHLDFKPNEIKVTIQEDSVSIEEGSTGYITWFDRNVTQNTDNDQVKSITDVSYWVGIPTARERTVAFGTFNVSGNNTSGNNFTVNQKAYSRNIDVPEFTKGNTLGEIILPSYDIPAAGATYKESSGTYTIQ